MLFMVLSLLRKQAFGLAILACAGISFAFPSCFKTWFGVRLLDLVVPAIQVIMFGMGTTLSLNDFLRVAKCPWVVATRVFLQFLVLPLSERDARTVAIEVGLQNGGMAGALAIGTLKSAVAALPANVFSIWMNFSGSILANHWSKKECK